MHDLDFERQLQGLRTGELRLDAPEQSGLTPYAAGSFNEMKRYMTALETGYRALSELVDAYRAEEKRRAKVRQATAGRLTGPLWSKGAALGYAVMGMRQGAFSPPDMICVLEAMEDAMELYSLEDAAEAHQDLMEGRRTGPNRGAESGRSVSAPTAPLQDGEAEA